MSWLKMTSQAKNELKKKEEDEQRQQQILAKQKEKRLLENLEALSSEALQILEIWTQLDCDRILVDIQKQLLGGNLDSLKIVFSNNEWSGLRKIIVDKTSKEWLFGEDKLNQLTEVLLQNGYDPNLAKPIQVTRCLYIKQSVENYSRSEDTYYTTEETKEIFKLTIDSENIYCGEILLGKLEEIKNVPTLESHIDEILARQIMPKP